MAYLPGVTGDNQTRAGLLIDGGIEVDHNLTPGYPTTFGDPGDPQGRILFHGDPTGGFTIYKDGGVEQTILDNGQFALATTIAGSDAVAPNVPYVGDVYFIVKGTTTVWRVRDTGTMLTQGGLGLALTTKTADYTATDSDSTVVVNAASKTVTLPSAVTAGAGRMYVVVNGPSGATTTVASVAGTINGASTDTTLTTAYNRATFQSDGTDWIRIG